MIADLGDEDLSHIPPGILSPARSPTRITDHEGGRAEEGTHPLGNVPYASSCYMFWLLHCFLLQFFNLRFYISIPNLRCFDKKCISYIRLFFPNKVFLFFVIAEPITFPSGSGKSFIMGSEDVLESVLGLGDLADLTVTNESDYSYDVRNLIWIAILATYEPVCMFLCVFSLSVKT